MAERSARVERVVRVAAEHAAAVDRDAAFPRAAIAALRAERLLAIMVPQEAGGEGAGLAEIVDICYRLGQACAATAMIHAMHQIMVGCIIRHGTGSFWHRHLLGRIAAEQLLLASSTTEAKGGGNLRASEAPIIGDDARVGLERRATVISYGADADAIVTTARRAPEAAASDQVLAVFLKEDYALEGIATWDTLGMRGTCSAGFILRATGAAEQILPEPYEKIHAETMVPFAHLTWAGVWAGIAAGAVERVRLCLRHAARQSAGRLPPGAPRFAKACGQLAQLRGLLSSSVERFAAVADDRPALLAPAFQTMINLLKVEASELAVTVVMSALAASGLSGYRNDSEFALGRHLRDVLSAPLMINNERILANIAPALAIGTTPASLYR